MMIKSPIIFQYTLVLLLSFIFPQNFIYDNEDWFIIPKPGAVNAITETSFEVYFATDNGVYVWDKQTEQMDYDFNITRYFDEGRIYHFYYDPFSDYFWIVHNRGLSYKSSVASNWRDAAYSPTPWEVDDIGSSIDYIFIRNGASLSAIDPFTGWLVELDEPINESLIEWGYSRYGQAGRDIDMSRYYINPEEQLDINSSYYMRREFSQPTVEMKDSDDNHFIGTLSGEIYLRHRSSDRLNIILPGLSHAAITEMYLDEYQNWWFADSKIKRGGLSIGWEDLFLTRWIEDKNKWIYYYINEDPDIIDANINCLIRHRYKLYIGTMDGLLILSIPDRKWTSLKSGLSDNAIWDMTIDKKSLFVATARGVDEVSLITSSVIPDTDGDFESYNNLEVYDLENDGEHLYVAARNGLRRMDWQSRKWEFLSNKFIRKIDVADSLIFASDGQLWQIIPGEDEYLIHNELVFDFAACKDYIWINEQEQAVLIQYDSAANWTYDTHDGIPGESIFEIDCDDEWVWFGTDDGIAFYKWSNYHR